MSKFGEPLYLLCCDFSKLGYNTLLIVADEEEAAEWKEHNIENMEVEVIDPSKVTLEFLNHGLNIQTSLESQALYTVVSEGVYKKYASGILHHLGVINPKDTEVQRKLYKHRVLITMLFGVIKTFEGIIDPKKWKKPVYAMIKNQIALARKAEKSLPNV